MEAKKLQYLEGLTIETAYVEGDCLELVVKGDEQSYVYRFRYDPINHGLQMCKVVPVEKSFLLQRDLDRQIGIETAVPVNTVCYSN